MVITSATCGNGESQLRIIPLSRLANGERRSPEDIDVALIADIGCTCWTTHAIWSSLSLGKCNLKLWSLNILEIKHLSAD